MTANVSPTVGFVGLGAMGEPMALNLARAAFRRLDAAHTSIRRLFHAYRGFARRFRTVRT